MTDQYTVSAEKCGHIIAVYVKGGLECSWLRMYLDCKTGQMACDSDIGTFACRIPIKTISFSSLLKKPYWLLKKCVKPCDMRFSWSVSESCLCQMVREDGGDLAGLKSVLQRANEYTDSADAWLTAVDLIADRDNYDLPCDWAECVEHFYMPQQTLFAKICRDVIAPEVERVMRE